MAIWHGCSYSSFHRARLFSRWTVASVTTLFLRLAKNFQNGVNQYSIVSTGFGNLPTD